MKRRNILSVLSVPLSLVFVLCGCAAKETGETLADWTLTEIDRLVDLHTDKQLSYLVGDYSDIAKYATGEKELSRPESLRLEWSAQPKTAGEVITDYTVEYTPTGDFSDALTVTADEMSCEITNLRLDTVYSWRVTANFGSGKTSVSPVSSFMTDERGPRNLYVDGVTNVRDLGGWLTADGVKVKQGMIFRCGRLNRSETETPAIEITEKGIDTMLRELGVRTEIDLRMKEAHNHESGGITSSPLGDTVRYENVQLEWGTGNYLLDNLGGVREFFTLAADESNYPFIFHCNIGTDRTGMFAFLINGLLGVSEEDLYRDYLFSNFGNIGGARQLSGIENDYLKTIRETEGETLSEKITNCLIANGIPAEQLDAIERIMK